MPSARPLLRSCALTLALSFGLTLMTSCGDDSSNSSENVGGGGGDPCAAIVAQNDGAGASCGDQECPSFECLCEDGTTVSTRSCFNGACEGLAACEDTCQGFGSSDACDDYDPDSQPTNNTTGNNTSGNNTSGNNSQPASCDADISPLLQTSWTRDEACLKANCCDSAAACATLASCPLLDDCLYDCFSGGTVDQSCVQSCHEQYPAQPEYNAFSSCALNNGC